MFRPKRYSSEEAARIITNLNEDDQEIVSEYEESEGSDDSKLSSNTESESFSDSSETDEDQRPHIPPTRRRVRTRGGSQVARNINRVPGDTGDHSNTEQPNQSQAGPSAAAKKVKKCAETETWLDTATDPQDFPFTAEPGMKIHVPENPKPQVFFELLLDENIVEFMVERTNAYAKKVIDETTMRRSSRFKAWKDTCDEEMRKFLGLLLHMGVINMPKIADYWSKDPFLKTELWRNVIGRDRFLLLLRFWHFEDETSPESRLQKISPLMNHFNQTMSAIYCPDKDLALDESMVLWRGRLIFRQYIKNKRHKYGIKLYELCESNGLILRSVIYSGVSFPDPLDLGQTAAIVLQLMSNYLGKGYTVYTDNYYNSVKLTKKLTSNKTYICGTLRSDRKGNPKAVTSKKLKKGEMFWLRNEDVVVTKWKDRRDVLTITNKHSVEMVPVKNRRGEVKMKPNVIRDYNNGMSGIDRSDQMLSYYQGLRKTVRWYKKVGFHFIEMFVHNAHCLYNKYGDKEMRLYDFRLKLIKHMIGPVHEVDVPKPIENLHYLVPLQPKPDSKKKFPTKQCRRCRGNKLRRETRYFCAACPSQPALCLEPCFPLYHK